MAYIGIYCAFGLLTIILAIILNSTLGIDSNKRAKRWNTLLSISGTTMVSSLVFAFVMSGNAAGTGDRIGIFMAIMPVFITHMIFLITTLLKKEKYKPEIIRYNKNSIITAVIIVVLTGILIAVPKIIGNIQESKKDYNKIYMSELQYLTAKYGDHGFEAIGEGKQTAPADQLFRNERVLYYYAQILEPTSGTKFTIYKNAGKYKENFLERYYSEITNKYLQKYNVSTSFYLMLSSESEKIPDNFGRIPTLDELSEKITGFSEVTITKNDFYYADKDSQLSFLKELSYDLAKCLVQEFKIGKNTKLKFEFDGNRELTDIACYYINISNYKVIISDSEKNALVSLDLTKVK